MSYLRACSFRRLAAWVIVAPFLIAADTSEKTSNGYDRALESGKLAIPYAKDMSHFFPGTIHLLSYYTGEKGTPTWQSRVGLYGRYVLYMEVEIKFDAKRENVVGWGKPSFLLREVDKVTWDAKTRVEEIEPGPLQMEFGAEKWQKVVESKGDLESLGISLKKKQPVPGFEEHWHRG